METKEIIHKNDCPLKIVLLKGRDCYNWEIHVNGRSIAEIVPQIHEANNRLRGEFGGKI